MKLSVVIPARDEADSVVETLTGLDAALAAEGIPFELVVVDDGSTDETADVVRRFAAARSSVRLVANTGRHGFGMAVRKGLEHADGQAVTIVMADASDSPADVVECYRKLQQGYDCVFGSRFMKGSRVVDYPVHKLVVNRLANWFINVLFHLRFNDCTNAFKMYRRRVIEAMQPLISPHFNLTVEMPLKAVVRGFNFAVIPITWTNRKSGVSKLKLKEMGSRYLFIVLYLWLEKTLVRRDYQRQSLPGEAGEPVNPEARHV